MHSWNDGFKYFAEVGEAADWIGTQLVRWGRINVTTTKEKWGCARVYCSFGVYSLYSLLHPRKVYITGRLAPLNKVAIPYWLNHAFSAYQILVYKAVYYLAIKKWPMIKEEIISGADYNELLQKMYSKDELLEEIEDLNKKNWEWRDKYWTTRWRGHTILKELIKRRKNVK
jgi:hypothetical protein